MIYLASPYTHPSKEVEANRARCAATVAAHLCSLGFHVFSPIAYGHALRAFGPLPGNWEYWQIFDTYMVKACSTFAVLPINGWRESIGVGNERLIASRLGREEVMLDPYNVAASVETLKRLESAWRI
jgi:hypothetical protein